MNLSENIRLQTGCNNHNNRLNYEKDVKDVSAMTENDKNYLRKLSEIQRTVRAETDDGDEQLVLEAKRFLKTFGEQRQFGEPVFIRRMRLFYLQLI